MEEIIDQLVAQGYEVSGSNSSIRVKMGFVSAIIAEIHLQPVRQIVRMANSKLSSPVA